MAPRKPKPTLVERTPLAEWIAAGIGLALTLTMVGYTVWEGANADRGPPQLSVVAERARPTAGGYALPIIVRNNSHATAADVDVVVTSTALGQAQEERRAHFAYVPGRGEARGGVMLRADPAVAKVSIRVDGYAEP